MSEDDEVGVLTHRVPELAQPLARVMAGFATFLRSMNAEGRIAETLSLRVLLTWGTFVVASAGKEEHAQAGALSTALLHDADVPFGISAFANRYSQVKSFDTSWKAARRNFQNVWGSSTVLGPAVSLALAEIAARDEERKLFMLITDGEVDDSVARFVISELRAASRLFGVETATVMLTDRQRSPLVRTLTAEGFRADVVSSPERLGKYVIDAVTNAITM